MLMPDKAVEIISPSQSQVQARRKAKVYLRHGAAMVWLKSTLRRKTRSLDRRQRRYAEKRNHRFGLMN